jgi:hypothetical protein
MTFDQSIQPPEQRNQDEEGMARLVGRPAFRAGGEAAFTLHCPGLGAVEVRMQLDGGGIRAAVATPPGAMTERAAATLPDLVAGLERATGRPGIASVRARRGSEPQPTPPEGSYDGDA